MNQFIIQRFSNHRIENDNRIAIVIENRSNITRHSERDIRQVPHRKTGNTKELQQWQVELEWNGDGKL